MCSPVDAHRTRMLMRMIVSVLTLGQAARPVRGASRRARKRCRERPRRARKRLSRRGEVSFQSKKKGGSRSLSRVLSWTTIPLGVLLPARSSSLPGSNASHAMRFPIWPCFRWGLPCRPCYHVRGELLPRPGFRPTAPTCAGAPFHPCLIRAERVAAPRAKDRAALRRPALTAIGGLFSVALSVTSRCPVVNRHLAL